MSYKVNFLEYILDMVEADLEHGGECFKEVWEEAAEKGEVEQAHEDLKGLRLDLQVALSLQNKIAKFKPAVAVKSGETLVLKQNGHEVPVRTTDSLRAMPTLETGVMGDLKVSNEGARVWINARGVISVQWKSKDTGKWVLITSYQEEP